MNHEIYMRRCLELARNGLGTASPNPMVGSVIVFRDKIIGEGWHHKAGEPHAEVIAINQVSDKSLLKESTIYVNLEPCSHHGRTPPCADLILSHSIPRVVIANIDPHKAVAGSGIERLRNAGIEVISGVLEDDGRWLNRRFFCRHEMGRPYVILKWAQSRDGFMDTLRRPGQHGINWITHTETQSLVHQWRSQEDAIMIGRKTLINDNPSLTTRFYAGKNPIPILITSGNLPSKENQLLQNQELHIITNNKDLSPTHPNVHYLNNSEHNPGSWLRILSELGVLSVMVEGGAKLIASFIEADLWDEARVLCGTSFFEQGLKAPSIHQNPAAETEFGKDRLKVYRR